jgi:hypothetical protein
VEEAFAPDANQRQFKVKNKISSSEIFEKTQSSENLFR